MILKGTGKLYRGAETEPFATVKYSLLVDVSPKTGNHSWSGECILTKKDVIREGEMLTLELETGHRGNCSLRKKVNKAVMGLPVRFFYHISGLGNLSEA
jgi:hypothetical protein